MTPERRRAIVGDVTAFRDALTALGLAYHLRVQGGLVVWPPGTTFTAAARRTLVRLAKLRWRIGCFRHQVLVKRA